MRIEKHLMRRFGTLRAALFASFCRELGGPRKLDNSRHFSRWLLYLPINLTLFKRETLHNGKGIDTSPKIITNDDGRKFCQLKCPWNWRIGTATMALHRCWRRIFLGVPLIHKLQNSLKEFYGLFSGDMNNLGGGIVALHFYPLIGFCGKIGSTTTRARSYLQTFAFSVPPP